MPAPYRNEVESLEARKRALEAELESVETRLKEQRRLPLLDRARIATPCSMQWDDLQGHDERKRFCRSCKKHVYNVSSLTKDEAEAFLHEQLGRDVCVFFYRRADGTIMTSDCEVGRRRRLRTIALVAIGAGALAVVAASAFSRPACRTRRGVSGGLGMEPDALPSHAR
ncbi:MAG: hypothetical protein U0270_29455 [Labilithrix sp.]